MLPLPASVIPVIANAPVLLTSTSPDVVFEADKLLTAAVSALLPLTEPIPVFAVKLNVPAVTLVVAALLPLIEPAAADKVTILPVAVIEPLEPNEILLFVVVAFILTVDVNAPLTAMTPLSLNVNVPPVTPVGVAVPTTVIPPVIALEPIVKPPVELIVANCVLLMPNTPALFAAPTPN